MKVEVKEQETFQPITLTITIQSEEELCNLWHRMNAQHDLFNGDAKRYPQPSDLKYKSDRSGSILWEELNELVINYKLLT